MNFSSSNLKIQGLLPQFFRRVFKSLECLLKAFQGGLVLGVENSRMTQEVEKGKEGKEVKLSWF